MVNNNTTNQGNPNPIKISKIFEPIALLIAIPGRPFFATIIDAIKSGIEVPIAIMVKPIIPRIKKQNPLINDFKN